MEKKFVWASAHKPTPQQIEELRSSFGMSELEFLPESLQAKINNCPSNLRDLVRLSHELEFEVRNADFLVQLGGSPAFQNIVARRKLSTIFLFAHSERESVDEPQPDGSVLKKSVFRHSHFIEL
jgi:hypothetical protein